MNFLFLTYEYHFHFGSLISGVPQIEIQWFFPMSGSINPTVIQKGYQENCASTEEQISILTRGQPIARKQQSSQQQAKDSDLFFISSARQYQNHATSKYLVTNSLEKYHLCCIKMHGRTCPDQPRFLYKNQCLSNYDNSYKAASVIPKAR